MAKIVSFNENQNKFIRSNDRATMALAIPGSGKTAAVVGRIGYLLNNPEIKATRGDIKVLALTFTKEAAQSLKVKVAKKLPNLREGALATGTFHSIFLKGLKRSNQIPFSMKFATQGQVNQYLDTAIDKIHGGEWRKIKTEREREKYRNDIRQSRMEMLKANESSTNISSNIKVLRQYKRLMEEDGFIDFDSILEKTYEFLITKGKGFQLKNQPPFSSTRIELRGSDPEHWEQQLDSFIQADHIIVDEAQDIDDIQFQIMMNLFNSGRNVDIVGDDDQSIYAFRNSLGYKGMRDFQDLTNIKQPIIFDTNYRSDVNILRIAGGLIKKNDTRVVKTLGGDKSAYGEAFLTEFSSTEFEIEQVVSHILDYKISDMRNARPYNGGEKEEPITYAVICRLNKLIAEFEEYLTNNNIEYTCPPGESMWEANPLCFMVEFLNSIKEPWLCAGDKQCLIWSKIITNDNVNYIPNKLQHLDVSERQFYESLKSLKLKISEIEDQFDDDESASEFIGLIYEWFFKVINHQMAQGIFSIPAADYFHKIIEIGAKILGGDYRINNLKAELEGRNIPSDDFHIADKWGKIKGSVSERVRVVSRNIGKAKDSNTNPIHLMTMHGSKGLEFDRVWLVGCDDRTIPGDVKVLGDGEKDALEEERRLLYVGITRAKSSLFISHSKFSSTYKKSSQERSRLFNLAEKYLPNEFDYKSKKIPRRNGEQYRDELKRRR